MGRKRINLDLLSFSNWTHRVRSGSRDNVYESFYATAIPCDSHYILVGQKKDGNILDLEEGVFRGVAHSEEEARTKLISICREEAKRMKKGYDLKNEPVEIFDNLLLF